ncbi:MAG: alpha-N-arabinofuranosidase [Ruminococcus sp.]|nr:alpha-N-arabinofuranosidase [Ruminococcus sp.]
MKNIRLTVDPSTEVSHINREIYGHFSEHLGRCIYNGLFVGEGSSIPNKDGVRKDIIEALKNISIPVLRWPGGCFADEYHWKDGIGPKETRKKMINTNWGGVVEDNSFGTHEFMDLCEELGCEPYVAGNVGSGTVREMSEWIEYMTFDGESPLTLERKKNGREKPWKLKYFGIGNENWGCGGNMRPEYYADVYRQFQSFCKNYSGNQLYKVACGPSGGDYNWTRVLLQNVKPWHTKGISLHHYTIPSGDWNSKGSATKFSDDLYYSTIRQTLTMDDIIKGHTAIMDELDPKNEIGLLVDEWGCWYDVEEGTNPGFLYQQNTMRDAIVAAVNLNIFNTHSRRVVMANIAQMINVLQAVILTEGEKMILTPTYHVFYMYKGHQDAELVKSICQDFTQEGARMITSSVSKAKDGSLLATVSNASLSEDVELEIDLGGYEAAKAEGTLLNADVRAYNTFDAPENVKPEACEVELREGKAFVKLPACSVVSVRFTK